MTGSGAAKTPKSDRWKRHIFYKTETVRTTWKFRLALVAGCVLLVSLTRALWIPSIGRGLVCQSAVGAGDAILVENFDPSYLVFERAGELLKSGVAARVLIPTAASSDPEQPNLVSAGIVEVMARVAQVPYPEIIPIREIEPISLNVARQICAFLQREQLWSIIVVTPAFRSRRSMLIYRAVFDQAGITASCAPVFAQATEDSWAETWHGILNVSEEQIKLQYYRFYILPRLGLDSR
jgi:hypothetical protein